jgi:SAM-dependent methyltransferase
MRLPSFSRSPKFTAHNIQLGNGRWTLRGEPQIGAEPISIAYLRMLRQICPPPARVADLGSLEGGYAVHFARAGYEVLGIEGQPENFARCQWVAERVGLENLRFVQDDVRNIAEHGEFDAVLCAGLLYHLDRPVEFLRLLGRVTRRALIVSTNHATVEGGELEVYAPGLSAELSEHEGRLGRWFEERPSPWSSVGNERSFWLERDELLRTLVEVGFPTVLQQFDWVADLDATRRLDERRVSVFVAIKPPEADQTVAAARNSS